MPKFSPLIRRPELPPSLAPFPPPLQESQHIMDFTIKYKEKDKWTRTGSDNISSLFFVCSCFHTHLVGQSGADPEFVSGGAEPMSSAPPLPTTPSPLFLPSLLPFLSLPYLSHPSFPSLSPPSPPLPSPPLEEGVRGSSSGKFWNSRLLDSRLSQLLYCEF